MKINSLFGNLKLVFLSLIVLVIFSSCGVNIPTIAYDDVYATNVKEHEHFFAEDTDNKIYQDDAYTKKREHYREFIGKKQNIEDNRVVENDSLKSEYEINYAEYDEDDYYDYAYSARLRRFYHPFAYSDYYADYYTNLYWYTHDPLYWGTSIYLGYSWWYPSYYSRWYDPFYWPYASWYCGPHYHHHHHHYPHHHGHHHDICYFNSMDNNSNMYRGSSTGGSIKRAGNVTGTSIKNGMTRTNSNVGKATMNKKPSAMNRPNGSSNKYNKPTRATTSKPNFNTNRGGKVSTINRQTNSSSRSFNRSSGSSFNRSGSSSSSSRSSGSSFGGGSRGGSSSGGSIRR